MAARENDIIYDWNEVKRHAPPINHKFKLVDETLRDGIQSPFCATGNLITKTKKAPGGSVSADGELPIPKFRRALGP